MKTLKLSLLLLLPSAVLSTTWVAVHSQQPQRQTNSEATQQLPILQLSQKPKIPIVALPKVPLPPGNINESMKARRDYAWQIVKLVWQPVKVGGSKVPLWMSWYEQEDITDLYKEMLNRQPRPTTYAQIVAAADAVMQQHSTKDLQASISSARLAKVLRQFTFPAIKNISHHVANGTIYYSPSYVKHLLENADNVVRCDLSNSAPGIPPKCIPIANELKGLKAERAGLQQDLQKAAGSEKPALAGQIKQLNQQITKKQQQLDLCLKTPESAPVGDNIFATCLDSEMPPDAFMIKANWAPYVGHLTKPLMGGQTGADADEITGELLMPPYGIFKFGNAAYATSGMVTITDENGKQWMLTGMHIASKSVRTWLWTSLFWGATSLSHGGWALDEPTFFQQNWPGVFDYGMCTVSGFQDGDPTPWNAYADGNNIGTQPLADSLKAVAKVMNGTQWCANPFIETDTARTNCISCHQGSTDSVLLDIPKQRKSNISDFSFSFATNRANFLKIKP